jgi:hypothetical protein
MSLRTLLHGTVTWMPFAGRIESGCVPSSRARTSSAHTPAAFTTARTRTSNVSPSARTVALVTRPSSSLLSAVTAV